MSKKENKIVILGARKEKEYIIENLSMLIASGIGVSEALDVVSTGIKSSSLKKALKTIQDEIDAGTPLWRVFDRTNLLPKNMVNLIKIGESSGRLPENLKIISAQQQKERTFKSRLSSAMMYPTIVFGMTITIGFGISFYVLPKLANIFGNMRIELPPLTRILINSGKYLEKNYVLVGGGFLLITLLLLMLVSTKFFRSFLREVLMRVPKIGLIIKQIEISRFGFTLGTLLAAGMSIMEAIDSLVDSTSSISYKKMYQKLRAGVEEGKSLEKTFQEIRGSKRLIPMPVQQMVFAGERSGELSVVLSKIDEIYEEKIEVSSKNIATVLEPILLIVVWFAVLFVALAVIMPIYGLIGGIK